MDRTVKPLVTAIFLLGLAALGPAPLRPYSYSTPRPERSQEQRTQDQQLQGVSGPVGVTDMKDGEAIRNQVDPTMADPTAKSAISNARINSDEKALDTIKVATDQIENKTQEGPKWWIGALCLAGGFGGVMMLKNWAEKQAQPGTRLVP